MARLMEKFSPRCRSSHYRLLSVTTGTLAAVDRGLKFEKLDDGFGRVISLEKI